MWFLHIHHFFCWPSSFIMTTNVMLQFHKLMIQLFSYGLLFLVIKYFISIHQLSVLLTTALLIWAELLVFLWGVTNTWRTETVDWTKSSLCTLVNGKIMQVTGPWHLCTAVGTSSPGMLGTGASPGGLRSAVLGNLATIIHPSSTVDCQHHDACAVWFSW